MKTYRGKKSHGGIGGQTIMVEDDGKEHPLKHIKEHSDGLNWGYGGSGPADAALSILTDCLGEQQARSLYMEFKWTFVAGWADEFSITEETIKNWARQKLSMVE